jgi:hypothetical protein
MTTIATKLGVGIAGCGVAVAASLLPAAPAQAQTFPDLLSFNTLFLNPPIFSPSASTSGNQSPVFFTNAFLSGNQIAIVNPFCFAFCTGSSTQTSQIGNFFGSFIFQPGSV